MKKFFETLFDWWVKLVFPRHFWIKLIIALCTFIILIYLSRYNSVFPYLSFIPVFFLLLMLIPFIFPIPIAAALVSWPIKFLPRKACGSKGCKNVPEDTISDNEDDAYCRLHSLPIYLEKLKVATPFLFFGSSIDKHSISTRIKCKTLKEINEDPEMFFRKTVAEHISKKLESLGRCTRCKKRKAVIVYSRDAGESWQDPLSYNTLCFDCFSKEFLQFFSDRSMFPRLKLSSPKKSKESKILFFSN